MKGQQIHDELDSTMGIARESKLLAESLNHMRV